MCARQRLLCWPVPFVAASAEEKIGVELWICPKDYVKIVLDSRAPPVEHRKRRKAPAGAEAFP
jgi:hypothetical protein